MRILLDTHVLIWLVEGDKNLSTVARSAIEDEGNSLYLSIVSLWEITIKLSLGKLDLQLSVDEMVKSFLIPGGELSLHAITERSIHLVLGGINNSTILKKGGAKSAVLGRELLGMIAGRLDEGVLTGGDADYRPYATRSNQGK